MENSLTDEQLEYLIVRHRLEKDSRIKDRIKAILAYDDGYTHEEIAKLLLIDDETVRRHLRDYFERNKLEPENGGSESKLTDKQSNELIEHLANHTYLYVKDICAHIKKVYGIKYSRSGMTKWLLENNFSYKKPHATPAKMDPKKQKEFVEYYNNLKKEAEENNELIYFVDSVHPQHQTKLAYGWIRVGERKCIAMTGRQYRVNIIGGICLKKHNIEYVEAERIDAATIKSFMLNLSKKHTNQRINIILDNAGYHHSKDIIEYAEKHRIKLHYLPPYSPNLNPIERLWKIMHENVTYNQYYEKFSDFTEAILGFFENINQYKRILRRRITDNFHLLNASIFAS